MSKIRLLVLCCALTSKDDGLSKRTKRKIFVRGLYERLINIIVENILYKRDGMIELIIVVGMICVC